MNGIHAADGSGFSIGDEVVLLDLTDYRWRARLLRLLKRAWRRVVRRPQPRMVVTGIDHASGTITMDSNLEDEHEEELSPESRRLLERGIEDAKAGRVTPVDLGSFAKYADDNKEDD